MAMRRKRKAKESSILNGLEQLEKSLKRSWASKNDLSWSPMDFFNSTYCDSLAMT